jgi:hypothetical protein
MLLEEEIGSLRRTPALLGEIVKNRPDEWLDRRHRADCLSPREVITHFIVGEQVDWMPRIRIILDLGESRPLDAFDVYSGNVLDWRPVDELLKKFAQLRGTNVERLEGLGLTQTELARTGIHPDFGRVTLDELIATWVAHDLYHLGQIFKAYASPLRQRIGPWQAYLNLPDFN